MLMKIYDISQEVFACEVYPGDPTPKKEALCSMAKGDLYNLTAFSMCAHNGTHIDAPSHFLKDGKTAEAVSLERTVGAAFVAEHEGELSRADAERILQKARSFGAEAAKRILIKGASTVTLPAAETFADVPADAWYAGAVHKARELGIVEGVGGGLFEPDRAVTRAEAAAMMVRLVEILK